MNEHILIDWDTILSGIRHWLAGGDPYGPYTKSTGIELPAGAFAYPPATLLLGAPVALLPLMLSGILMLLVSVIGFEYWTRKTSQRSGLLWLLLWLPLCQGLQLGQISLLVLVGLMFAERAYHRQRDILTGVLLALVILKPQTLALPVGWLLLQALLQRRWRLLAAFGGLSALLWLGILAVSGPEIYRLWLAGLQAYGPDLPHSPLVTPPVGILIGLLAAWFWWRSGRDDPFGALLLLNTLLIPLSIPYAIVGIAFVVIRWRHDWPWYPLVLSWCFPLLVNGPRTFDTLILLTQTISATGLLAGVLPSTRGLFQAWRGRLQHQDADTA